MNDQYIVQGNPINKNFESYQKSFNFPRNQNFYSICCSSPYNGFSLVVKWICEIFNKLLSTNPTDPNWLENLIWLKNNKETNSLLNVYDRYNLKIQIYNFVTFEFFWNC